MVYSTCKVIYHHFVFIVMCEKCYMLTDKDFFFSRNTQHDFMSLEIVVAIQALFSSTYFSPHSAQSRGQVRTSSKPSNLNSTQAFSSQGFFSKLEVYWSSSKLVRTHHFFNKMLADLKGT